jgi:hypothetical protein
MSFLPPRDEFPFIIVEFFAGVRHQFDSVVEGGEEGIGYLFEAAVRVFDRASEGACRFCGLPPKTGEMFVHVVHSNKNRRPAKGADMNRIYHKIGY